MPTSRGLCLRRIAGRATRDNTHETQLVGLLNFFRIRNPKSEIAFEVSMPLPADLAFAALPALGQGLRGKQFTSVELTEFFLDRLEKTGPRLNAVVTVTREWALAEATQADRDLADGKDRGPLHGIPYGAKDLLAT